MVEFTCIIELSELVTYKDNSAQYSHEVAHTPGTVSVSLLRSHDNTFVKMSVLFPVVLTIYLL